MKDDNLRLFPPTIMAMQSSFFFHFSQVCVNVGGGFVWMGFSLATESTSNDEAQGDWRQP